MISQPSTTVQRRALPVVATRRGSVRSPRGLSRTQRLVKRLVDLVVATLLLLLALPVLVLLAAAIVLESPGPVIFRRTYVGEGGRLFDMFRFRTTEIDSEVDPVRHIRWHRDVERLTWVGTFMRDMNLDDLPLLLNVLRGDISLVGPRPELAKVVEKYEAWQRLRLSVPQGLTGWSQVTAHLGAAARSSAQDDLYYVAHYSLWLDIKIILMTIPVLLEGKGEF